MKKRGEQSDTGNADNTLLWCSHLALQMIRERSQILQSGEHRVQGPNPAGINSHPETTRVRDLPAAVRRDYHYFAFFIWHCYQVKCSDGGWKAQVFKYDRRS